MSAITFDTHAAVKRLLEAGVEERQAEAFVATFSDVLGERVTKADLEPLATKADLFAVKADLYRALWMQAVGIVGLVFAIVRFLG